MLCVIANGLVLTTLPQSKLLRLDRVQNEAMRVILCTTKITFIKAMHYLLDLPPMETTHKAASQSVSTCDAEPHISTMTGKRQVMDVPSRAINPACVCVCVRSRRAQASKGLGKRLVEFKPHCKTLLPKNVGTHCPEWPARRVNAEVQMLVEANCKPHEIVIYTDGSVTRDRSGWGFTVKQGGRTVPEDGGTHRVTNSCLNMEVEPVTHAIQWLASQRDTQITHAIIFTDLRNLLQNGLP